jgi:hypothetical protein
MVNIRSVINAEETMFTPHQPASRMLARLVTLAAVASCLPVVQAASYVETFSGPLNPGIWNTTARGNSYEVTGGELVFTRANGNSAELFFLPQLQGSFDVSVDYRLIQWSYEGAGRERLGIAVVNVVPPDRFHAVGLADGGNYHYSAVDSWCCAFPNQLVGSEGRLRITRGADHLVRTYVWTLGAWVLAGTSTPDTQDMSLGFSAYTFRGFFEGTQFAIDNFSIQADGFSIPVPTPVPEPSTWALMALGLGALAARARHARQGAAPGV